MLGGGGKVGKTLLTNAALAMNPSADLKDADGPYKIITVLMTSAQKSFKDNKSGSTFLDKMRIISMDYLLSQLTSGNVDELRKIFKALMDYLVTYFSSEAPDVAAKTSFLQVLGKNLPRERNEETTPSRTPEDEGTTPSREEGTVWTSVLQVGRSRGGPLGNFEARVVRPENGGGPKFTGGFSMTRSLSEAIEEFTGKKDKPLLQWLIEWSEEFCEYEENSNDAGKDAAFQEKVQNQIEAFVGNKKFEKMKKTFKDFVNDAKSWSALKQVWFFHGGRDLFCTHTLPHAGAASFIALRGSMWVTASSGLESNKLDTPSGTTRSSRSTSFLQAGRGPKPKHPADDAGSASLGDDPNSFASALTETQATLAAARNWWDKSSDKQRKEMAQNLNTLLLGTRSAGQATFGEKDFDSNIKLIANKVKNMEPTKMKVIHMLSRGLEAARGDNFVTMAQEFLNALAEAYTGSSTSSNEPHVSVGMDGKPLPIIFTPGVSRDGRFYLFGHLANGGGVNAKPLFDLQMDIRVGDGGQGSIWNTFKMLTHQDDQGGAAKFDLLEFLAFFAKKICVLRNLEAAVPKSFALEHYDSNPYLESRSVAYLENQNKKGNGAFSKQKGVDADTLRKQFRALLTSFFGHPEAGSASQRYKMTMKRYITDNRLWNMVNKMIEERGILGLLCKKPSSGTGRVSFLQQQRQQRDVHLVPDAPPGGPPATTSTGNIVAQVVLAGEARSSLAAVGNGVGRENKEDEQSYQETQHDLRNPDVVQPQAARMAEDDDLLI
ncbi:unnamed protein product [Amoebophrya sp. A25]|nr:unnamed protein product [Amoebophrya sp. A25]|eukprot:GSA25T00022504001.1